MKRIESSKINRELSTIIEQVAAGESFALTRYGKVVAHITPPKARRETTKLEAKPTRGRDGRRIIPKVSHPPDDAYQMSRENLLAQMNKRRTS